MVAAPPSPPDPTAATGRLAADPLGSARATLRSIERRARGACPLAPRGALLAAASAASLWVYAFGELDLVVFALGVAGLALVSIAALLTLATTLALRRRLRSPHAGQRRSFRIARFLDAGEHIPTGFELRTPRWLALAELRWSWCEPASVRCQLRRDDEDGRLSEEIQPLRRCEAERLVRRFSVCDAFGLTSLEWEDAVPAAFRVLPDVGRLRQVPLLPALASADGYAHPGGEPEGDRMEIRPYAPGDSVRDILWKAYARSGHLSVRRPERSVSRQRRTVAYLVAAAGDEAAAAAARVALESRSLGPHWHFGADGTGERCSDLGAALAAIARSGSLVSGDQAAGLASFLERAARDGDTHCLVFAPGTVGAWTERALAAARTRAVTLSFLVAVDLVREPRAARRPVWQRWLLSDPLGAGTPREEVDELIGILAASGAAVQAVERTTGVILARPQQWPPRQRLAVAGGGP